MCNYALKSSKD